MDIVDNFAVDSTGEVQPLHVAELDANGVDGEAFAAFLSRALNREAGRKPLPTPTVDGRWGE